MTDHIENQNPTSQEIPVEEEILEDEEIRDPDCYVGTLHLTGRFMPCEETILLGFFNTPGDIRELKNNIDTWVRKYFSEFYPGRKCHIDFNFEPFYKEDIPAYIENHKDKLNDKGETIHKRTRGHNATMSSVLNYMDYMSAHSTARSAMPSTGKQD